VFKKTYFDDLQVRSPCRVVSCSVCVSLCRSESTDRAHTRPVTGHRSIQSGVHHSPARPGRVHHRPARLRREVQLRDAPADDRHQHTAAHQVCSNPSQLVLVLVLALV
jgi:hypothetical protein